jgi:hypothetical protein
LQALDFEPTHTVSRSLGYWVQPPTKQILRQDKKLEAFSCQCPSKIAPSNIMPHAPLNAAIALKPLINPLLIVDNLRTDETALNRLSQCNQARSRLIALISVFPCSIAKNVFFLIAKSDRTPSCQNYVGIHLLY